MLHTRFPLSAFEMSQFGFRIPYSLVPHLPYFSNATQAQSNVPNFLSGCQRTSPANSSVFESVLRSFLYAISGEQRKILHRIFLAWESSEKACRKRMQQAKLIHAAEEGSRKGAKAQRREGVG